MRVGVRLCAITMLALLAYALLPHRERIEEFPFLALTSVGFVGAIMMWAFPWRRVVSPRFLNLVPAAWATFYVLLISVALDVTGGSESALYLLYIPVLLFIALVYPLNYQIGLLAVTMVAYTAAILIDEEPAPAGDLVFRLAILGIAFAIGSFISSEFRRVVAAETQARDESERRAALFQTVAVAARDIGNLKPDEVIRAVVHATQRLGFEAANISEVDHQTRTYASLYGLGLPEEYLSARLSFTLGGVGMCIREGRTVVVDDYRDFKVPVPSLQRLGFRSVMATPIRLHGELRAVLVGGAKNQLRISDEEVEAFELLAAQASRALEVAEGFEQKNEALERLRELDRMKSDFISTVSHEIRTPLTAIEGFGSTLERYYEELGREERLELLMRLNANSRVLHDIVTNLLDFSRIEEGKFAIELRPVGLAHRVEALVSRLQPLLSEHVVTVDVNGELLVEADPLLLDRVLENLLANAAKYTPAGTHLWIEGAKEDDRVRIVVGDEGPGIPADELDRLGERFFRGGDPNDRQVRGAGLGLAFAIEVLELHGSRLDVTSSEAVGTQFSFVLPLPPTPARMAREGA
ncbi:MAG TPA: ATP-binding protein [Actinomycetota bacterium]|nr:ATP-binding protein [Actinomycetota bacterium]